MSYKDPPCQTGRRPNFTRSYSESSAHYLKRKLYAHKNQNQEEIRENVNIDMPSASSEIEPLIVEKVETNQERKRGARQSHGCFINISSCNPKHCWKESKKRKIKVSYYCVSSCLFCSLLAFLVLAIPLYICYSEKDEKQQNRLVKKINLSIKEVFFPIFATLTFFCFIRVPLALLCVLLCIQKLSL